MEGKSKAAGVSFCSCDVESLDVRLSCGGFVGDSMRVVSEYLHVVISVSKIFLRIRYLSRIDRYDPRFS